MVIKQKHSESVKKATEDLDQRILFVLKLKNKSTAVHICRSKYKTMEIVEVFVCTILSIFSAPADTLLPRFKCTISVERKKAYLLL